MLEALRENYNKADRTVHDLERELEYAKKDCAAAKRALDSYEGGLEAGTLYTSMLNGLVEGGMDEYTAKHFLNEQTKEAVKLTRR